MILTFVHEGLRENSFQKNFSDDIPDILNRLELDPETWVEEMKQFRTDGITTVGTVSQLQDFCQSVKKKFNVGFKIPALEQPSFTNFLFSILLLMHRYVSNK